ncbi:hypothetical protein FRC10_005417 [Ceratobasidium sp. 414]|nr:hypothetical protein FRC10_005417 [Ceratobasidium sp. 414]
MKLRATICGASLIGAGAVCAAGNGLPVDKVYGVNVRMPPIVLSCPAYVTDVARDALTQKLGQTQADKVFAQHWSTWFTQADVNRIADAGLNTVRIPLGYWIVEELVDRSTEYYVPRGGMQYLKQGLRMLKAKGINVILDFHALPGVASPNQMFAGRCTSDVQFYTEENYDRALTWASVMTTMIHTDPDFSTVFALEAINEPVMDYSQTPGLGDYEKNFVKVVRHTEQGLGIQCSPVDPDIVGVHVGLGKREAVSTDNNNTPAAHGPGAPVGANVRIVEVPHGSSIERRRMKKRNHRVMGISARVNKRAASQCLMTTFMNKDWQYNNPAFRGSSLVLSRNLGGVADPNPTSYMQTICSEWLLTTRTY